MKNLGKGKKWGKNVGKMVKHIGTGEELDQLQTPKLRIYAGNIKMQATKHLDASQEKGVWVKNKGRANHTEWLCLVEHYASLRCPRN